MEEKDEMMINWQMGHTKPECTENLLRLTFPTSGT